MKLENISQAYQNLDRYSLNDVAVKELNKLTTDGVTVKITNETMYDRFVNVFDKKRVVLEKKSDILHHYYSDTTLCKDLTLDQQNESLPINLIANTASLSLVGYTAYSSIIHRTPFVKAPGLVAGLAGIHYLARHFTNKQLEKRLERPWKIHTYRLSKGLGPTNVRSHNHDLYTSTPRYQQSLLTQTEISPYAPDYLYERTRNFYKDLSIYKQFNHLKRKYPYDPEFRDFNLFFGEDLSDSSLNYSKIKTSDPTDKKPDDVLLKTSLKNDSDLTNDDNKSDVEDSKKERLNRFRKEVINNDILLKPQTFLSYETFEPRSPEEIGENTNIINYKNQYDDVYSFASGSLASPSYTDTYLELLNYDDEHSSKFHFDWNMNLRLQRLQREVYIMRTMGVDEEEVRKTIHNFNNECKKAKAEFFEKTFPAVNTEKPRQSYLVHSEKEEKHLKKFFDFSSKMKITMLPHQSVENDHDFDFYVDEDNYCPWEEYRRVYKDLFLKGRKYFIVQSIPEWKFLQVRKPEVRKNDELYNEHDPSKPNYKDSIFHMWSLERYHRQRVQKENLYQAENQTHKI